MLTRIQVRNFAIIDELELEFSDGLTVLTGETGAGKSILIDALGLVLGDRGDKSVVADGAARAEISAGFDLNSLPAARDWLVDQALEGDTGDCVLRRVIATDGRSRAFINSNSVALQNLREFGELLVEIHGQHAHQSLTRTAAQRAIIDHYGELQGLSDTTAAAFDNWRTLDTQIRELEQACDGRDSRLDFLQFQVRELEDVTEAAQEFESLKMQRDRLANANRLAESSAAALAAVFDDDVSAQSRLADGMRALAGASELDPELAEPAKLLAEADVAMSECADSLRRYLDALEPNPLERDRVEGLLDTLQKVARKHRIDIEAIPEQLQNLTGELANLTNADVAIERMQGELAAARANYDKAASALSRRRAAAAKSLAAGVTEAMQKLGMTGGSFCVEVASDTAPPARHGNDTVQFQVSANPGQPARALSKVASGGELSRISLAIQVIAADVTSAPTVVFDEVDSGVGGGVAEIVGRRLRDLGKTRQVLCVTHLAQVASQGHHHLRVSKISDARATRTRMHDLSDTERIEEVARMLGGVKITERTREHAREMLRGAGRKRRRRQA